MHSAIRWFKCKLKPPKKYQIFLLKMLVSSQIYSLILLLSVISPRVYVSYFVFMRSAKMSILLTSVKFYWHFNGQAPPLFFTNNEQSSGAWKIPTSFGIFEDPHKNSRQLNFQTDLTTFCLKKLIQNYNFQTPLNPQIKYLQVGTSTVL